MDAMAFKEIKGNNNSSSTNSNSVVGRFAMLFFADQHQRIGVTSQVFFGVLVQALSPLLILVSLS